MERLRAGYAGGLDGKSVPFYDNFTQAVRRQCADFLLTPLGLKRPITAVTVAKAAIAPARWTPSSDAVGGNAMAVLNSEFIIPTPL